MKKIHLLLFSALSLLSVIVLPVYVVFFLSPAFTGYITTNTEFEAVRVGRYLASVFVPDGSILSRQDIPADFPSRLHNVLDQFLLKKIKVFSANGTVLYSTEADEIGKLNQHDYFHRIVAGGRTYTKLVQKETPTLEGKRMQADVVETYVPIMQRGRFVGAFEIYYDVTSRRQQLNAMLTGLYVTLAVIVSGLLCLSFFGMAMARRGFAAHSAAVAEVECFKAALAEEEEACRKRLAESNGGKGAVVRGVVSTCRSCGRLRDAQGDWLNCREFVDKYRETTSAVDICPDCDSAIAPGG
ncbi:MAG: hypothetical protein AB1568_06205 [Thermodesulfobacteriota bacterium]